MPVFAGHFETPRALAATPRLLCIVGDRVRGDSAITIVDHVANKPKATIALPVAARAAAVATVEGKAGFVVGADDGLLRFVDEEGALKAGPDLGSAVIAAAAQGTQLVAALADGHAVVVDLATFSVSARRQVSERRLRAAAISESHIAVAGDDGVVTSVMRSELNGELRKVMGHEGPVTALAFLRDGRLASAGDDGTLRLWYLTGAPDAEVRGADKSGHDGGVRGLVFVSSGAPAKDGSTEDRLYSVGVDGTLKGWRLEDKKKPRTIDDLGGALTALCVVPKTDKKDVGGSGTLFFSNIHGRIHRRALANPNDWSPGESLLSGLDKAKDALTGARARREEAIASLSGLDDDGAVSLLLSTLANDKEGEVRAIVATSLGKRAPSSAPARRARAALKTALSDKDGAVRKAAYTALAALEPDDALAAPRAALSSSTAKMRITALKDLAKHRSGGDAAIAASLISKHLVDSDANVSATALGALLDVTADRENALRTALLRGNATVRLDALVRTAMLGLHKQPALADLFARAFDDDDASVRDRAFALAIVLRKPLAALLTDSDFSHKATDIGRRVAQLRADNPEQVVEDEAAKAALASLPAEGTDERGDDDDRPLLLALASRRPDTALRGAWGLARFGDTRALGAILQLTRHEQDDFRRGATLLLRAFKNDDARTRLVWLLNDKSSSVRAAAFDTFAAGESDPLVVADVGLRSASEDIRVRALQVLLKAAGTVHNADHRQLLDEALDDESAAVRAEATKTLLVWSAADLAPALERLRTARFKDTRLAAVARLDDALAPPKGQTKANVPWAEAALLKSIADLDESVAVAAWTALSNRKNPVDDDGKRADPVDDSAAHLAGMASVHGPLREKAAKAARRAKADDVRSALIKQLLDDNAGARHAALETLDALLPTEQGPMVTGLASNHIDLRVRAGELLALRHDDVLVDAMKAVIADRDTLVRRYGVEGADHLRRRAAAALATLGKPGLVKYFATELLKDEHPGLREEAARGLATATRRGDEPYLLDAIGHADVWVRSWAAEGLARLGDPRCLPVLAGTLKSDNLAIRRGAVLAYSAFGPEGHSGLLQGLDDDNAELEHLVFSIVLAWDLQAARRGEAPSVLSAALSAARPEVRFAAARALELRQTGNDDDGVYARYVTTVLAPEKPEKPAELRTWPESLKDDDKRHRLMLQLVDALTANGSEQRYAAANALLHRHDPKAFGKAVENATKLRSTLAPHTPDNRPRAAEQHDESADFGGAPVAKVRGFLRRVFSTTEAKTASNTSSSTSTTTSPAEAQRLRQLAFGAYVGLLRQQTTGDEGQRVRRDAVERVVQLATGSGSGLGREAAVPALMRALDDGQHLVRKAALAGLKTLFANNVDDALGLALMARAEDVARLALDELAERGSTAQVEKALNSPVAEIRTLAFETLEKRAKKGSIHHLVLALKSESDALRLQVLDQLSKRRDDASVGDALAAALDSEHKGLVLKAAELLADRGDERAIDALAGLTVGDDDKVIGKARNALAKLGTKNAVAVLLNAAADPTTRDLAGLAGALAKSRKSSDDDEKNASGDDAGDDDGKKAKKKAPKIDPVADEILDALAKLTKHTGSDDSAGIAHAAYAAGLELVGKTKKKRDDARAARFFPVVCTAPDAALRLQAVKELSASGKGSAADDAVVVLFADRDLEVRKAAVAAYAERVRKTDSPTGPLSDVVKRGARELVLAAAEGLAWVKGPQAADECLVPLLLVSRAAESEEDQGTALVALGRLGDPRALPELELVADGGTPEVESPQALREAALEGLGRLHNHLLDPSARTRIFERLEAGIDDDDDEVCWRAVRGLRAIGDERSKQVLVRALDHDSRDDRVIAEACEALAALGAVEAEQAIAACLQSWDDDIRGPALKALKKLFPNDRARVYLHVLDKSNDDGERLEAASIVAAEASVDELVPRLITTDDDERRTRLRLGLIRRPTLDASALVDVLKSTKPKAVAEAASIIAARPVEAKDTPALSDALIAAEARHKDVDGTVVAVVAALLHLDKGRAATFARTRLPAVSKPRVQRVLIEAIGRGGSADDVNVLVGALRDPNIEVRAAAAAAVAVLSKTPWQAAKEALAFDPLRVAALAPNDAARLKDLLKDDNARVVVVPKLVNDGADALVAATNDAGTKGIAVEALSRVDDDLARERLSTLARDKASDANARKHAYRSFRRAERLHDKHARRDTPDAALPSWSGRVGEKPKAAPVAEVTK
ncbi:MAG TPA: HEAT repeat domain-containing protein [Myxococcota bacterium]